MAERRLHAVWFKLRGRKYRAEGRGGSEMLDDGMYAKAIAHIKAEHGIVTTQQTVVVHVPGAKPARSGLSAKRARGKAWMSFYAAHGLSLVYAQVRPVPFALLLALRPARSDCSGTTTGCFKYAGAGDPNGYGYDPNHAWTGYIRQHLRRLAGASACQVMDPIVYGHGQNEAGDHVAMVYEAGPDPLMFSHGQNGVNKLFRHSVELAYHGGYCTFHDAGC